MEPAREGRHLAAIMFVDMVGYSARMQENEPRTITLVNELWSLVRPILGQHGGREVDLAGDGMLMEFPGALAAVRCALTIHQRLHDQNRSLPQADRLRTRAGVHLGDIEHRDGRIYGDGVNIAARLLPFAPPGGLVFSPHVRDQLLNVLEQVPQRLGCKTLKNIRVPLEIWCLPGPECGPRDLAAARTAAQDDNSDRRWIFGTATLDERTLELSVAGHPVELEKKALDVLLHLLNHAGEVVTKDELVEAAWPGRIISDSALTTCIAKLRAALDDDGQDILKTVHGFGYRLAAPVTVEARTAPEAPHFDFREGEPPPLRPLWRLIRRLGGGGHGEAWLARHEKTSEERVYKFALAAEHLASLKREITLSRLLGEAPGARGRFTRVLDWNLEQAPYFIECDYCAGGNLIDWARSMGGIERVPLESRLEIAAQAAEALAAAHAVGVLHKDLKPGNLLIEPAPLSVRLSDFGSGGVLDPARLAEIGITRLGFTKTLADTDAPDTGTVLYLAPEVLAGQPWTAQADLYALGLILFQLVVGDLRRTLAPGWEHDVPDELLREDIARAAAGNPQQRFESAAALAQQLRTLPERRARREAQRTEAVRAEKQHKTLERYRYRRWWTATVTILLTLTLFYSVFMETDYGKALSFTYDEIWSTAERQEAAGNLYEAERLIRHIVAMEESRATLRFSLTALFAGFAGPDHLIAAKLKLANLLARQGQTQEADDGYLETLEVIRSEVGTDGGRYALAQVRYAQFLAENGRISEARDRLEQADGLAKAALGRELTDGAAVWNEDEERYSRAFWDELSGKITGLRQKHGLAPKKP